MPNSEVITALRNAIDHGDTLESAKQVMINSGYNPREIEKASHFIGGGVTTVQQPKPGEQLTMPNQKKPLLKRLKSRPSQAVRVRAQKSLAHALTRALPATQQQVQQQAPPIQPVSTQQVPPIQPVQQVQQQVQQQAPPIQPVSTQQLQPTQVMQQPRTQLAPTQTQAQLQKIKPKRKNYMKEIVLLIVLLGLIGLLITTIIMKDTILGWFS